MKSTGILSSAGARFSHTLRAHEGKQMADDLIGHGQGELCLVCGSSVFEHTQVLRSELISAWDLSGAEAT
jgi:hypothetical protein